jgi:hypothetical protein
MRHVFAVTCTDNPLKGVIGIVEDIDRWEDVVRRYYGDSVTITFEQIHEYPYEFYVAIFTRRNETFPYMRSMFRVQKVKITDI